jgi:integrase
VADSLGYPIGALCRLLLLSGLRLSEAAKATWSEIDLAKREWTIPKERMKRRKNKARPNLVPLTPDMVAVINNLPRFDGGDFIFSNSLGVKPSTITDKVKKRIDKMMLLELRQAAKQRGDMHPERVKLKPFVTHDLRRVVRSAMSSLEIPHEVAEQVLAHVRPGISANYDVHSYANEKRNALETWNAKLRSIIASPSDNLVTLQRQVRHAGS